MRAGQPEAASASSAESGVSFHAMTDTSGNQLSHETQNTAAPADASQIRSSEPSHLKKTDSPK